MSGFGGGGKKGVGRQGQLKGSGLGRRLETGRSPGSMGLQGHLGPRPAVLRHGHVLTAFHSALLQVLVGADPGGERGSRGCGCPAPPPPRRGPGSEPGSAP